MKRGAQRLRTGIGTSCKGIEGRSLPQLQMEISQGGKFVIYRYNFSVVIMSVRRASGVYYIPPGESAVVKGLPWTLLSLAVGWWGLPWGLIWTPASIYHNLRGGTDVTAAVMESLGGAAAAGSAPIG